MQQPDLSGARWRKSSLSAAARAASRWHSSTTPSPSATPRTVRAARSCSIVTSGRRSSTTSSAAASTTSPNRQGLSIRNKGLRQGRRSGWSMATEMCDDSTTISGARSSTNREVRPGFPPHDGHPAVAFSATPFGPVDTHQPQRLRTGRGAAQHLAAAAPTTMSAGQSRCSPADS